MDNITCEDVLMAKMAEADGERRIDAGDAINFHVDTCEDCRREIKQIAGVDSLLLRSVRQEHHSDLWSRIETDIRPRTKAKVSWRPFAVLCVILVGYRFLEMFPTDALGYAFRIVPFLIVAILFAVIRENPFRIKTEYVLGETGS